MTSDYVDFTQPSSLPLRSQKVVGALLFAAPLLLDARASVMALYERPETIFRMAAPQSPAAERLRGFSFRVGFVKQREASACERGVLGVLGQNGANTSRLSRRRMGRIADCVEMVRPQLSPLSSANSATAPRTAI